MRDPREYVCAVIMAREAGITAEELHEYFPLLADEGSSAVAPESLWPVDGDMLATAEEIYEEEGTSCHRKVGFRK